MSPFNLATLSIIVFFVAFIYSSIGHGGATAYLAAMALFDLLPEEMRITALILNIIVAGIGTYNYYRARAFSWRIFWPFALGSLPFTFLGSTILVSHSLYDLLLGMVLIISGCWIFLKKSQLVIIVNRGSLQIKLFWGAAIGFLSGLTGMGGGVLLGPLLIINSWVEEKKISGITAAFILMNSVVSVIGYLVVFETPPIFIWYLIITAAIGGILGSKFGVKYFNNIYTRKILGLVMLFAGVRIIILSL